MEHTVSHSRELEPLAGAQLNNSNEYSINLWYHLLHPMDQHAPAELQLLRSLEPLQDT